VEHILKQFAEALNKSLDELDVPIQIRERATIFSKMLDIPKQQAWNLLEGLQMPDQALLARIQEELEIDIKLS
jgi:hypothetical protein